MPPAEPSPTRRPISPLRATAWIALSVRLAWTLEARRSDPNYAVFVLDSAFYDEMARKLLAHGPWMDQPFLMAPLYGYFLAAVYAISGWFDWGQPTPALLAQGALGAGTTALAARLGERYGGRPGAWAAGLITALHAPLVLYDARLLSVELATFLTAASALALQRAWDSETRAPALLAGLLLGTATLARGNLLFAAPLLVLALGLRALIRRHSLGPTLALALAFAAPLGLSALHNHRAGGGWAPVAVSGGINLYRGNNPYFVDRATDAFRLPTEKDGLARRSLLVASVDSGRWLSQQEADRYWTGRALSEWRREPSRYLALFLRKSWQVLSPSEDTDNVDVLGIRASSRVLRLLPMLYGPMVALGLVGAWVRRREALPALLLVATGVGSIALFYSVDRYRLPLVPVWAALAGGALAWMGGDARRLLALAGSALATAGLLHLPATSSLLPWNALAPPNPPPPCALDEVGFPEPAAREAFQAAADATFRGRFAEAEPKMEAVLSRWPTFTPAWVDLSYLQLQRGAWEDAARSAGRAVALDACDDKAMVNQATALNELGRAAEAVPLARRALEIDPYDPGKHRLLGEALALAGQRDEAREMLTWAATWDPTDEQARQDLERLGGGDEGTPDGR